MAENFPVIVKYEFTLTSLFHREIKAGDTGPEQRHDSGLFLSAG